MSASQNKLLISIVVPVYNEATNLPHFLAELVKVIDAIDYRFEIMLVDDGSSDNSVEVARGLQKKYPRIKVLQLVRNFGKEAALTAGLHQSQGDAAIIIDADLQHPVACIPEFIERWERGAEVVIGVRRKYGNEPVFKRFRSRVFYALLNSISETKVIPNSTDFRLLDRVVIDTFNTLTERNRITRGLIDWLGYASEPVYFDAQPRHSGEAAYSLLRLIQLALNSFISLSLFPLKLAGYLGVVITTASGVVGCFILVEKYVLGDPGHYNFTGTSALAVLLVFLVGILLSCLGLIALYIANIHAEVINRPLYIVKRLRTHAPSKTT